MTELIVIDLAPNEMQRQEVEKKNLSISLPMILRKLNL